VLTLVLALQNVIISEGRYRKPVEPLLLLNLVWVLGKKVPRVEDAIRARAALRAQAEV
jgi:hypothetical protein